MKKRIISAIVACAIFIPLVIIGKIPFLIGLIGLSILAFRELLTQYERNGPLPLFIKLLSYLSVVTLAVCEDSLIPAIGLIFLFVFISLIFIDKDEYNIDNALHLFGSIVFVGFIFYIFNYIRVSSLDEFIYIFLVAVLTDTFAYFGGMLFGKHKLIPKISPNKTIEGALIGLAFGTMFPTVYYIYMISPGSSFMIVMLISLVLSIVGQLGDLIFSSMKRYYKIKDFSKIMPGHGGVLDRLDSVSFIGLTYVIIRMLFL